MTERPINSILAADFGSVNTRALLFDIVEGEYRLVAQAKSRTTIGSPIDDVHEGLSHALREIAQGSGRRFFDEGGALIHPEQVDRAGVDYYVTTASAGLPTRAVLAGLYEGQDLAAARQAIAPFYIEVAAELHLEDGLGPRGRLNRIVHSRPGLILITGGTDGGARTALLELLAQIRQAVSLITGGSRPTVVFAGNSSLTTSVREMLGQHVEVLIAPNIRGRNGINLDGLQRALAGFFEESKGRSKSYKRVAAMTDSGIQPSARGIETMTAFFARQVNGAALSIDFGSARSQLSFAQAGTVQTLVRNDIGVGHSAAAALDLIGEPAVTAWLPFHPRRNELAQYALDKGLRVDSVPLDMRERYIEYALLRAGIRYLLAELQRGSAGAAGGPDAAHVKLALVAGAAITGSGQGALDLLLLADALQSEGLLNVKSDPHGALAGLGALAAVEPKAVVQLLNNNVLENVGTLIRVVGKAPAGATALKVSASQQNGERLQREVTVGDVWHLPVPANAKVDLRIQARRGLSVGGKRRLRLQLSGGRGGVLFDARLGAMDAAASMTERAVNMLRWFAAVTGQENPVVIPESWLAGPET
ncbi:MAG: glutamate mutase L [Chloroflexi bacterium]|nr:glutamate mutase L [Chloroflexota bacterium]